MKPSLLLTYYLLFAALPMFGQLAADTPPPTRAEAPWVDSMTDRQYFAVRVADMDRSVAWYQRALGLEVLDDTSAEDGRWRIVNLTRDGLAVELIQDRRDRAAEGRVRGLSKVGFEVQDLEPIADRVAASGEERPRILDFDKHSLRLLQVRDPDGNVVQLFSPMVTQEETTSPPSQEPHPMSITRINHFSAKPGSGDALYALIESFLPMIRESDGCLSAELKRGVDDSDQLVVVEVWRDQDAHRASAANVPPGTFEKAMALMAGPPSGAYYQ